MIMLKQIHSKDNLIVSLKEGSIVKYWEHDDSDQKTAKVLGKVSGKYANFQNIEDTASNETQLILNNSITSNTRQ